jgi:hypothetical protein
MVGVVGDARNVYQLLSLLREEEEESSELLLSSAFLESELIAKGSKRCDLLSVAVTSEGVGTGVSTGS